MNDNQNGSIRGSNSCDEESCTAGELNACAAEAKATARDSTVNSHGAAAENAGTKSGDDQDGEADKLNLLQVLGSVLAAGLGVQSSKNRERDFKQGRAGTFILAGLIFTALFIGSVYTVVSIVLNNR